MSKLLIVCSECGHEHFYTEDLRPSNCESCNSPLIARAYPIELLDQTAELVSLIGQKFNCSFDQACSIFSTIFRKVMEGALATENLFEPLTKPTISENLLLGAGHLGNIAAS